jgi:hypothetical protein
LTTASAALSAAGCTNAHPPHAAMTARMIIRIVQSPYKMMRAALSCLE